MIVPRLRAGGLLVVDNVLWSGRVVDPSADDGNTRAIRAYNDYAAADERVDFTIVNVGDSLLRARKRKPPVTHRPWSGRGNTDRVHRPVADPAITSL
jgi:hypothetical protein